MKIAVLGTGTWGSGIAQLLTDNKNSVTMYGVDAAEVADIENNHRNSRYFKNHILPESIHATCDPSRALDGAKAVVITVPTKFIDDALMTCRPYIHPEMLIINASKGFDNKYDRRMSDTIRAILGDRLGQPIASVIGPSHAEEVIERKLTSVCAVSLDHDVAVSVQKLFSNSYMRLYTLTDEVGAEYGVAMKNVIAIASGILVGRGYGDNAKAALVTRGLLEMIRYGTAKGGEEKTFIGLTGMGDLVVTCFSELSRNYRAGLMIGRDNSTERFFRENSETVEGVYSCKVIYEDAVKYDFELPIVSGLYDVLYRGKKPSDAICEIMDRPLKPESEHKAHKN